MSFGGLTKSFLVGLSGRKGSLACGKADRGKATAENELQKLRRQYRKHLAKAVIRNDRPGKSSTYTLRYFISDTDTVRLF